MKPRPASHLCHLPMSLVVVVSCPGAALVVHVDVDGLDVVLVVVVVVVVVVELDLPILPYTATYPRSVVVA